MVEEYVVSWFTDNSSLRINTRESLKDNYLESGYIDSFGFLDLISSCEEQFRISFNDDDFANDLIFTINGLIDIITEKMGK